jgi:hypothetical protein
MSANEWQPIETAPKDRVVLLYVPDMGNWPDEPAIVTAIWSDGQKWVDNGMAHCATYGATRPTGSRFLGPRLNR